MELQGSKIKEDIHRDAYILKYKAQEDNKKTDILACASWEYLLDTNRVDNVTNAILDNWKETVEEDIKNMEQNLFRVPVRYLSYAVTPEGEKNGLEILKKIK